MIPSPSLKRANKKAPEHPRRTNFLNRLLDNGYNFDDGQQYDIVIASEVFEHVLEPARLAANIRRRMTPGSMLIVTTPNGYGPWELKNRLNPLRHIHKWNWLRRRLGKKPYRWGSGSDRCQFFTRSRLHALLAEHSCRVIRASNSDLLCRGASKRRQPCQQKETCEQKWTSVWAT